jgi:endonuclease/exonuclease/phosphatase family metal-dependent hydrolase/1-acyl-sn-glycerol-3-phosphate acyltransferase
LRVWAQRGSKRDHYDVMRAFVGRVYRAIARIARVDVRVLDSAAAEELLASGSRPVVVLSRHAGEGDTLLVVHQLLCRYGRRPRVVMHERLRLDPLIDVLGSRLPNRFVNPHGGDTEVEIAAMARDAGERDAVLIFPEGANFTARHRRRAIERLEEAGHEEEAAWARDMRHVSAPRPGGALAAIEAAPEADVVFMGHAGFPFGFGELCLSGLAACYRKVEYPAVLDEAVARIRRTHPDAVTFNEACRNDVAAIARRTGYHLRFSTVIYGGKPLPCVRPRGRGLFGDAVLTKSAISSSESREFAAEPGIERRRWLCVTTLVGVDVCTSHLDAGNEAQCADLAGVLTRRATARAVIFGGDLNRRTSCAPGGFWTRTDASAHQDPGLQQVYGSAALRSPTADVVPATHTDHDVLLAHARLTVDAPG